MDALICLSNDMILGPPQRFRDRLTSFSRVLGLSVSTSAKKNSFGPRGCAADFEFSVYFENGLTKEKCLNSTFFKKILLSRCGHAAAPVIGEAAGTYLGST